MVRISSFHHLTANVKDEEAISYLVKRDPFDGFSVVGSKLAQRVPRVLLILQITRVTYRETNFLVRMGCGNHPLCSVLYNSLPLTIDFFKK